MAAAWIDSSTGAHPQGLRFPVCEPSSRGGQGLTTSVSLSKPGRSLRDEHAEPPLSWETKGEVWLQEPRPGACGACTHTGTCPGPAFIPALAVGTSLCYAPGPWRAAPGTPSSEQAGGLALAGSQRGDAVWVHRSPT